MLLRKCSQRERLWPPSIHNAAQGQMLGLNAVDELTRDFLVPLLSKEEADRMVGWNWGVSL